MKRKASIPTSALPSTSPLLSNKLVPAGAPSATLTEAGGSIMAEESTTVGQTNKSQSVTKEIKTSNFPNYFYTPKENAFDAKR